MKLGFLFREEPSDPWVFYEYKLEYKWGTWKQIGYFEIAE